MQTIYLDHSASTPVDARVLEAMLPYFSDIYGNSKAMHGQGHASEHGIDAARDTVAHWLNCAPGEVIFTSGGTESDNLALRGPAQYARAHHRPFTLITGPIEHAAIAATARQLVETLDTGLRLLPVDHEGMVSPDDLRDLLRSLPPNGITLVSLIHAHNEIGTINSLAECAAVAHEFGAIFHTDAVQSPGHTSLDTAALGVDMLSLSSHKFYGPKGAGVLFLRDGIPFMSSHTGASHEDGRRAGTHNSPGIVGTAKAFDLASADMDTANARESALRDRLIEGILARVPDVQITGHRTQRLPGHASFVFKDVPSTMLLMHLDRHGIAASSGSACKVGNEQPSPLLETLGFGPEWTRGGLRLSLGHSTTDAQIDTVLEVLPAAVESIRRVTSSVLAAAG